MAINPGNFNFNPTSSGASIVVDLEADRSAEEEFVPYESQERTWRKSGIEDYSTEEPSTYSPMTRASDAPFPVSHISFTQTTNYINYSDKQLYVTSHDGLSILLQEGDSYSAQRNALIVRKVVQFPNNASLIACLHQLKTYSDTTNEVMTPLMKELYSELRKYVKFTGDPRDQSKGKKDLTGVITFNLDSQVNIGKIGPNGIFLPDLNIVVSLTPNVIHPHDKIMRAVKKMSDVAENYECTGIIVEIIDNDHKYGPKYLYSASEVVEIIPVRNVKKENGVCIMKVGRNKEGQKKTELIRRLTVEEALEQKILFNSSEEAHTSGDPKSALTKEIERLKHENMINKHKNEKEIDDLKREMQEREAYYKRRSLEMNDAYEARSIHRKEVSEISKYIPTIIAGVAAGAGVFIAMRK